MEAITTVWRMTVRRMVYREMVTVREIFRNHDKLRPYDLFYQKQDIGFKQRNKVYKNIIRFNGAAIFSFKQSWRSLATISAAAWSCYAKCLVRLLTIFIWHAKFWISPLVLGVC